MLVFMLVVLVVLAVIFFLVIFVSRFVMFQLDVVSEGCNVQRVFVRRIGRCFRDCLRSAHDFLNGWFVVVLLFLVNFFCFSQLFPFVFEFVLFENGAAAGGLSLHNFAHFILLGIDQTGRKCGAFFVAEFDAVFGFVCDGLSLFELFDFLSVQIRFFCLEGFRLFACNFGGFSATSSKQPAGQRTT